MKRHGFFALAFEPIAPTLRTAYRAFLVDHILDVGNMLTPPPVLTTEFNDAIRADMIDPERGFYYKAMKWPHGYWWDSYQPIEDEV